MFEITNIFGRISIGILDKQRNEVAIWPNTSISTGYVHFRLIFHSPHIDYFTPNISFFSLLDSVWLKTVPINH